MKVGELYYGISIPQSEFRRVEAQLKRFETAMKQAGGREAATALRDTATAATEAGARLNELSNAWTVLNEKYVSGKIGSQEFVEMSRSIVNQLGDEMSRLNETSSEYASFAAKKSQISKAMIAEDNRINKTVREQAVARNEVTYANSRYAESSRLLAAELQRESSSLARIQAEQKSGVITKTQALQQYQRLLTTLQELRVRYEQANVSMEQQTKAFQRIDTAVSNTANRIERLKLATQGYNTQTLEGIQVSDSLTKAWLIGLGPQGYRLYLVLSVLKETLTGISVSVKGATTAFARLATVLKVGVIGTLLAVSGTIIAGVNQMLRLEDTMADVRKTTMMSADELGVLEQAFRGLSLQLPKSTDELAQIAVEAGRLGLTGTKNIYDFTKAVAEMDIALTGLGTQSATELGRFLNVLGIETRNFGAAAVEVGGILNELENNTASTAGEILDMASGLAQISSIANMSMRDIFAFSAALSSMGIRAEMAGSNLTRVFVDVVREVALGTEAVDQLARAAGMSRDEFVALTQESNGFSKAFQEVALNLGRANLSAEEFTLALETLGITNVRVRRVVTALAQGHHTLTTALEVANDETRTAESIHRELEIRLGTTRAQLTLLRNRFSAMVQVIGEQLVPSLRSMIVGFNNNADIIGVFGASVITIIELLSILGSGVIAAARGFESFSKYVLGAVAAVGAAIGDLSVQLGNFFKIFSDVPWWKRGTTLGMIEILQGLANFDWSQISWDQTGASMGAAAEGWFREAEVAAGKADQAVQAAVSLMEGLWGGEGGIWSRWQENRDRIAGLGPELAELLDFESYLQARGIDPELFDVDGLGASAAAAGKTVEDVMKNMRAALAALDNMADIAGALEREFDLPQEQYKLFNSTLNELVMNFGLAANSPEIQEVMEALRALGIDADEARARLLGLQEALTQNWVNKLEIAVRLNQMSPSEALHQAETAIDRLQQQALEVYGTGVNVDWELLRSILARIDVLQAAARAFAEAALVPIPIPDITVGAARAVGVPADPALLAQVTQALGSLRVAQEGWNEAVAVSRSPLETLYDQLTDIVAVASAQIPDGALQFIADVGLEASQVFDPVTQTFVDVRDAAQDMLDTFARTHFPELFGEQRDEGDQFVQTLLDLAQAQEFLTARQQELSRATTEAENPLGHLHQRLVALAEGSDATAEAAQRLLEAYADVFATLEAGSMGAISDDDPNVAKGLEEMLDRVTDAFGRAFTQSQIPVVELRNLLTQFMQSDIPEMVAVATGYMDEFDRVFTVGFDSSVESIQMLSRVMAGSFPPGLLKPLELEIKALGDELRVREQQLEQTAQVYGENSVQVRELQAAIAALRVRVQELTDEQERLLNVEEELNEAYLRRLSLTERAEAAIKDILAATGPQLTQTQRLIEQYEALSFLLGNPAGFESFIQLMRDKDAAEGAAMMAGAQEQLARALGQTTDPFLQLIPIFREVAELYPEMAAAAEAYIVSLKGFSEAAHAERVQEALRGAVEQSMSLMDQGPTRIQAYIQTLRGLGDQYGEIKDELDDLIASLEAYEAAMERSAADKVLDDLRKRLEGLQGISANPFRAFIEDAAKAKTGIKEVDDQIKGLIESAGMLADAWDRAAKIDKFISELDAGLSVARELFDLFQDDGWADGNKLLSAYYEITATVVSLIPVVGEQIAGIVRMVGEFINHVIGDMSNGLKQVQKQIDEMAGRSRYLSRDLVEELTATHRVSRGGLLGWLGFTKTAVDQELTDLRIGIAESFGGALRSGIMAALAGDQDWKDKLREGLKQAIAQALLDAFIQSMLLTAGMADFVNEFTRILRDEGAEAAGAYARAQMGQVLADLEAGAEIIVGAMKEYGFAAPLPPPEDYDSSTTGTHGYFTLPTATPGLITATPAWVDNLGMHFAKFGMYVDRLVDEGITINVNGGRGGGSDGVNARDMRAMG